MRINVDEIKSLRFKKLFQIFDLVNQILAFVKNLDRQYDYIESPWSAGPWSGDGRVSKGRATPLKGTYQLCLKKDACFEVFNTCKLHSVVFFKDWRNNGKKDDELDRGSPYFSYLMFFMNTVSHSWLSSLSYTILIFVRLPEEIVSLVYFVFQKIEFMLYSWPCGTQCFEVSRSNLVYEPRMRFAVELV